MLTAIRDNAKWFVGVPVVCFVALIFVDWGMSPGSGVTEHNTVGKVNGEKISLETFNKSVEEEAKARNGNGESELDAALYAGIRADVFEKFVRYDLLKEQYELYGLQGSPLEVLSFLKDNPPPGAEKAPIFMGPDSQFSRAKYLQWLSNPKVFDDPFMRAMEAQISGQMVPQQQFGLLINAAQPVSDLELRFRLRMDRPQTWGAVVVADADSFRVDPASVTPAQARAWFNAHPDTLWHAKKAARVPYIAFDKVAAREDSLIAKGQIDSVAMMARSGEKFADLASNYSEDPGSAKNGGDLGGFQKLSRWDPVFAAAARTLDSGKISDPVLTQFGWHVIQCKGRKIENGDTLYSLAHVLITIQISPETVDTLKARGENFRKLVNGGKSFNDAARAVGARVSWTDPIEDGELSIGLPSGYLTGLNNFIFRTNAQVSEVLENAKQVVVAGRGKIYPAGHDFDLVVSAARNAVAREMSAARAKAWLEASSAKIAACDTSATCLNAIGKLTATNYSGRPRGSYLTGVGYAAPELLKMTSASSARHRWNAPVVTARGAVMAKIDSVAELSEVEVQQELPTGRMFGRRARNNGAFEDWYKWCKSLAKIDNKLDRYYHD